MSAQSDSGTGVLHHGESENAMNPLLTVMDIDGVCADVRHRLHFVQQRPKQWDEFFAAAVDDTPLPQAIEVAHGAARLVYLSGRPERYRTDTVAWLKQHGFPAAPVHLRPDHDTRPAARFKPEALARLGGPSAIEAVYDDDEKVVVALRALGFHVVHVTWMPASEPQQLTLLDIQETQGRT